MLRHRRRCPLKYSLYMLCKPMGYTNCPCYPNRRRSILGFGSVTAMHAWVKQNKEDEYYRSVWRQIETGTKRFWNNCHWFTWSRLVENIFPKNTCSIGTTHSICQNHNFPSFPSACIDIEHLYSSRQWNNSIAPLDFLSAYLLILLISDWCTPWVALYKYIVYIVTISLC